MSQPDGLMAQDLQLVHYLLGLLPEKETDRLDEASIVNDEVAARLCGVEDDLVDAYVMGTLDQATREHFEASYLKSPRRRTKVKFARRFLTVVDRASSAPSVPATAVAYSPSNRVRRFPLRLWISKPGTSVHQSRVRWPLVTAVASFLLACGLLVNDVRFRDGLNQVELEGTVQDQRSDATTRPLDEARHENAQRCRDARSRQSGIGRTAVRERTGRDTRRDVRRNQSDGPLPADSFDRTTADDQDTGECRQHPLRIATRIERFHAVSRRPQAVRRQRHRVAQPAAQQSIQCRQLRVAPRSSQRIGVAALPVRARWRRSQRP